MLIDSHAHLDDSRFDEDRDEIIKSLKENKIDYIVNIGADFESSLNSIKLAKDHENIYAAVGIHPHDAKTLNEHMYNELKNMAINNEKVVAIGEIGLDYYYDNSPRDIQKYWFERQLELAKELDLPVVIHSRDATQDTFDIIKKCQDGSMRGVLHCYSGSVETMREYLKLGYIISLGGPVTFKKALVPKEVAKEVPLDKLLIETDSPYLTPEPYRGKRNDPTKVYHVAEMIADIRGISIEELAEATSNNAKEFFKIK